MNGALVRYDAMVSAIAECHKVDEIRMIYDKSAQLTAAARVAKDPQAIQMATEIKVRAERRLGQLLAEQPKANGGKPYQRATGAAAEPVKAPTPTLAQLGIDKKLSSRAQQLAKVPEKHFEAAVAVAREVASEVNAAAILQRQHPAPERREQPVESARVVIPESRAKDDETRIFELFQALDVLAKFPIPPDVVLASVRPYQRHRISNPIDEALEYLTALKAQWRQVQ